MSIEGRIQINRTSFIKVEAAGSIAPDFRYNPSVNNKFNLTDKNNKAFSFLGNFNFPKLNNRTNIKYKFIGSNFQSFTSFQTNAQQVSWSFGTEQYVFKKYFKLSASIRKNDFSNPYLVLPYQSSTVFKSAMISFRKRKLPSISVGYMPITQLSDLGGQVVENTFHSLVFTGNHFYKLKGIYTSTTIMYTKFFNSGFDSGFVYFNAKNCYISQQFISSNYTGLIGVTISGNGIFRYLVVEEQLKLLPKRSIIKHFLFGTKYYRINNTYATLGFSAGTGINVIKNCNLSMFYEIGFIPGNKGNLVNNNTANVQLTHSF
jgi:hypothetical protein